MKSSRIIPLFTELPASRRSPTSYVVSILVHGAGFGCLFLGLSRTPRIVDQSSIQHFSVRILNAPRTEPRIERAPGSGAAHAGTQSAASKSPPGGMHAPMPSIRSEVAQVVPRSQTLVQPDAPSDLLIPLETPIPLVLKWSAENMPTKTIVLPPTQKAMLADIRPSLSAPNRELKPADLRLSSTAFRTALPTLPPSTTSPVVVRGPDPARQVPEIASNSAGQPSPAKIMSLSDFHMKEGTVKIPFVNVTGGGGVSVSLAPGRSDNAAGGGNGNPASKQNGVGAGQSSGGTEGKAAIGGGAVAQGGANTGAGLGPGQGSAHGAGPGLGSGQGMDPGLGSGDGASVTRIKLPRDGQFGVVVVGSSLAEQYPETVGLWGGRLVYTVYLHVGMGKSWILQYSLPSAAQSAASGNIARPEAPWPYDIVRPHVDTADSTSDALMVHGFVNLAGRFERLALIFPTEFAQAKLVLGALQQWEFRPARQNGQVAAVEVLLIIPEETP